MPEVSINYLAVVVATLTSIVTGTLWYGPIFGKAWMKMMGFSKEDIKNAKASDMAKSYSLMMVGSLVMSFVLAHTIIFASTYLQSEGIILGMTVGFWNWLGFVAPVTMGTVLWEGKPWKLWMLNSGYYLVTLMIMGVILSVWS